MCTGIFSKAMECANRLTKSVSEKSDGLRYKRRAVFSSHIFLYEITGVQKFSEIVKKVVKR